MRRVLYSLLTFIFIINFSWGNIDELQLESALTYRILHFVTLPDVKEEYHMCIQGRKIVKETIQKELSGKVLHGNPITIITAPINQASHCDISFIDKNIRGNVLSQNQG